MKKILFVEIFQTLGREEKIRCLIQAEVTCPTNSELDIKRAIESTRNPNVLIETMSQGRTKEEIVKLQPTFAEIREMISKSDCIEAGFIHQEGQCERNCETCMIHLERQKMLESYLKAMMPEIMFAAINTPN